MRTPTGAGVRGASASCEPQDAVDTPVLTGIQTDTDPVEHLARSAHVCEFGCLSVLFCHDSEIGGDRVTFGVHERDLVEYSDHVALSVGRVGIVDLFDLDFVRDLCGHLS